MWQPIETAPKGERFTVALKTDDGYEIGTAELTSTGAVQSVDDCEPYFCRGYYCEATHWMPLPEPPVERSESPV